MLKMILIVSFLAFPALAAEPHLAARQAVLTEMDRMRAEIAILAAIRKTQEALVEWNRSRPGSPPDSLPRDLCARPALAAWCRLLPATFGTGIRP